MPDLIQTLLGFAVVGAILGLGLGLFGRVVSFLWRSTPVVRRREQGKRADFESDLRAFEEAARRAKPSDRSDAE